MRHSRVLVYGAGVIGTFYAELLAAAGEDVSLLARVRRLEQLRSRKESDDTEEKARSGRLKKQH